MKAVIASVLMTGAVAGTVTVVSAAERDTGIAERDLYVERCGGCHLESGFGTRVLARRVPEGEAELEHRERLPAAYVIAVVRNGLGSMPQIRAAELSDEELSAIAHYLESGS